MSDGSEPEDTAIALALKRAAGEKLRKKKAKRKEREAHKQARLDRIKVKAPDEPQDRPPEPAPAPQTGAALQVAAQHFLQDKAARERRIQQLAAIATGRRSEPEPVRAERLPPPPPSGPDDPRVQNGTLAPSPKVAAMLKAGVSESATAKEKPLQTSAFPERWLETLANGSPEQILAGRRLKDLKGDDLAAYWRARARRMAAARDDSAPRRRRKGAARCAVGLRIDALRHAACLTSDQVAERAGLSKQKLQKIVAGKRPVKSNEAERLAELFNVPPETFMSNDPPVADAAPAAPAALNGITPPKTNPKRPGYNEQYELKRLAQMTEPRETDSPFQANLRRIMRTRGLMAQHVAKLCGVSPDVPGRLLRTKDLPSEATRQKLLHGLGVTEQELFGAVPPTPSAPAAEAEPGEDHVAVLVAPAVPVEMGIPMPPIVLHAERYPWGMNKGGSFKAEVPYGMPWATFRSRFLSMIDRQSEKLGHWYTYEENEAEGQIRVWRYI